MSDLQMKRVVIDSEREVLQPIEAPYLLISHIPCFRDCKGTLFVDALWEKDLQKHLAYITNLTLLAPVGRTPPDGSMRPLPTAANGGTLRYVGLAGQRSSLMALMSLPWTMLKVWKCVRRAEIVHAGVGGWPVPLGWIAAPFARLCGRFLIIIIESAHWRTLPDAILIRGWRSRLRRWKASVFEIMARWCTRCADASFFTQREYQASLSGEGNRCSHIIHASWIDEQVILDEGEAERLWLERLVQKEPLVLLFAGRLTVQKGLRILLQAAQRLSEEGVHFRLNVMGKGELADECVRAAERIGPATIQVHDPLPYDESFFRTVRSADLVVVPSLSDEQPRIVYDAFSQAKPVLASDTPGLRDCIRNGVNGLLVRPNDPEALASAVRTIADKRETLSRLGLAAIATARSLTHEEMHRQRWRILSEELGRRPRHPGTNLEHTLASWRRSSRR
jgi:glycosyltransferase involved in cell wall biosynthesis